MTRKSRKLQKFSSYWNSARKKSEFCFVYTFNSITQPNKTKMSKLNMSTTTNTTATTAVDKEKSEEGAEFKNLLTHAECEQILDNISTILQSGREGQKPSIMIHTPTTTALQLKDFDIQSAQNVHGFLGEYYHLFLKYGDGNGEEQLITLFLKTKTRRYAEVENDAIFKKEVNLYRTLLQVLQRYSTIKFCPTVYFMRDNLLAMQNLQEIGYNMSLNQEENLSDVEMKHILSSLAAFHAASIIYELKHKINIGEKFSDLLHEFTIAPDAAWYTTGLHAIIAIIKQHEDYQQEKMQEFIEKHLEERLAQVYAMTGTSQKYRNVLCHRDVWRGNIFFHTASIDAGVEETQNSAIFIDYQTCCYCPPCIDVIYIIFMYFNRQDRDLLEMEYLMWYYRAFKADLAKFGYVADDYISVEEFLKSYREFKLFGCVYKTIAATIIKVPKELVTNEYKLIMRTERVLAYMQENPMFRIYMEDCIEDIMAYLLTAKERKKFKLQAL